MPNAMPTPRASTPTRPRLGSSSQPVFEMNSRAPAVATTAAPKETQRVRVVPPMIDDQSTPEITDSSAIHSGGTCGFARKSLKPMAPHSLRSTATQKDGSEYRTNDMNVTL